MDTGHSIKTQADLAFRREPREERGRALSCITPADQHSSISIEPTWLQPSHNAGHSLLRARETYYFISSSLFFDPRIRYIPLSPVFQLPPFPTVFVRSIRSPIFFLFLFSHCQRLSAPYFALLRIIPRPPTSPSRYARVNRIDFRLPRETSAKCTCISLEIRDRFLFLFAFPSSHSR